jgi:uncharacterized protein YjfI (DUF2170 family)
VTDIENKVDVTMADPSQQQGQQMPDIQQMLARLLVNQQALQNEFPGLVMRNVRLIDVSVMSLHEVQEEECHLQNWHQQLHYQPHRLRQ